MKKILLFTCLVLALNAAAQVRYQRKTYISGSSSILFPVVDVTLDSYASTHYLAALNDVWNGSSYVTRLLRYDAGAGTPVAVTEYSVSGLDMRPVRVLTVQGFTYVAGYTNTINGERFFLLKVNSATNAVVFCNVYNSTVGGTFNQHVTDMAYDGTGTFFITGSFQYSGNSAVFLAQVNTSGSLLDYRTMYLAGYSEEVCSIQWYAPNAIYIAGVATVFGFPNSTYGFLLTYDATAATGTANVYQYYAISASERLRKFNLMRIAKRMYAVGETYHPFIGNPQTLIVSQLNSGTQLPAVTTNYSAGNYRWTSRINYTGGGLLALSGYVDMMDASAYGVANVFFNNTTTYSTGSRYFLNTSYTSVESILDNAGFIHTCATRGGDTLFRIKALSSNGQTTCDHAFTFPPTTQFTPVVTSATCSVISDGYTFPSIGTVIPTALTPGNSTPCFFDPMAQRLAGPSENAAPGAWPNPAGDQLHISLPGNLSGTIRAEFLDLSGRLIRSEMLRNESSQELPVADLLEGMYLLRISDGNGFSETLRFVKRQ